MERLRNLGLFAHIDAGKTTLTERVLFYAGKIHRMGEVDDGDTQMDWMAQERERGLTITSAATTCEWRGYRLNLIDTPGHIDFTAEVERSLRVVDGAVIVLCAVGGVEPQTESLWRHADQYGLPRLVFVNKMDRPAADFDRAVALIRTRLGARPVVLQRPLGRKENFRGVIDLREEKAWSWGWDDTGQQFREEPIPPDQQEEAQQGREALIEELATADEELLEAVLTDQPVSTPRLDAALRRATLAGAVVPVLCGSALYRIGVQPVLDAVGRYFPSPLDRPPVQGWTPDGEALVQRRADPDEPFCALAFKTVADVHVGRLAFVRAYSGTLRPGDFVLNPRTGERERIGRILRIHANRWENTDQLRAGEVAALVGAKTVGTGDTLCAPDAPLVLEAFSFPDPVISVALHLQEEELRERLVKAVNRLCEEDPTAISSFDEETRDYLLSGLGELHLEVLVDRLRTEYNLPVEAGEPRVAYRETIRRRAHGQSRYQRQTGGHGHFADVRLRVDPLPRGQGVEIRNRAPRVEVPGSFLPAVRQGLQEALEKGVLAGYPVTDLRLTILGGRFHAVDSAALDFVMASSQALKRALRAGDPCLLEPIMRLDVAVPEECLGTVLGDLGTKRGTVTELDAHGPTCRITAEAPLAELFGYATDLRGQTQGRGRFTMEFVRYAEVPAALTAEILEAVEGARRQQPQKRRRKPRRYMD